MRVRHIAVAVAFLVVQAGAFAQNGGGISGVITTADSPVAEVPVQAKHQVTGRIFTGTSAKSGQYAITGLPDGAYDVSVPMLGIATNPFNQRNVVVRTGATTRLDIVLIKGNQGVVGDDNAYLELRGKYADVRGPAPRTADGHADLSGVWSVSVDPDAGPVSMLPWAEDVVKSRRANNMRDLPASFCLPDDPTPTFPLLRKMVQTRTLILQLFEQEPHYRQIFLDGRAHPRDADPTWMGHSTGKWERDTLVVDTVSFNDKSWIVFPLGLPHTEMLHTIERYQRPDRRHLRVDLTLEDPGTFTKPIERHMTWELVPGEEILESICTENNKYRENAGIK